MNDIADRFKAPLPGPGGASPDRPCGSSPGRPRVRLPGPLDALEKVEDDIDVHLPPNGALVSAARFLAFDLGAESGRALIGQLDSAVLTLEPVCRFPNDPVRSNGALQWDILRLWLEMNRALDRVSGDRFDSVGIDAWGCDFALIGEQGNLLENPYCYRDTRTDGVMEQVFARVSREEIYAVTGIQFLPFNTLYQLYAARRATPRLVDAATALVTIPDLLNYWFTDSLGCEFTIATTTQLIDARTRGWATGLLADLGLPTRVLPPLVEPGAVVGHLRTMVPRKLAGTPVVAPASHDTASAFAAVAARGTTAFLSSGTWSLLGTELDAPVITPRARDLNFTNEGGASRTTRLLKNIGGLWLLQACRREWAASGHDHTYDELLAAARTEPGAFQSLFDPDHPAFFHPSTMAGAIADYCRQTGQSAPRGPAGYSRAILESLAFKYRTVLESLEELTGVRFEELRIVGGGSRNRLLNQFTADALGRPVVAGPVEATALGNIAVQMLAAGVVGSLAEARQVIDRSFPVERFEPLEPDRWDAHYGRFREYLA
jgi:rhamnulokinase